MQAKLVVAGHFSSLPLFFDSSSLPFSFGGKIGTNGRE
jgi:hypothetical protein